MSELQNKFDPNKHQELCQKMDEMFIEAGMPGAVALNSVVIEPVVEGPRPTTSLDELDMLLVDVEVGAVGYVPTQRAERSLITSWYPGAFLKRP